MGLFQRAVKQQAKLRLAIAGPSGSGKTYTALSIASHLAGDKPIAVLDTEHGSASKYADLFEFDVLEMSAPYHPDRFVEAIAEAANAGYGVIILDSMSHAWSGTGGLLEIVDNIAKRMKSSNSYAAWKDATPIQNRMVEAMLAAPLHIIATVRSKQEYSMEKDDRTGKTSIRKVGMAPVQRDGFEYEFDVFFDMDIDNNAIVSKSRCPALAGQVYSKPGKDVANILAEWLGNGVPTSMEDVRPMDQGAGADHNADDGSETQTISPDMLRKLNTVGSKLYNKKNESWDNKRHELVAHITGGRTSSSKHITDKEAQTLIDGMQKKLDEKAVATVTGKATQRAA